MKLRDLAILLVIVPLGATPAPAQTRVRTETIKPPPAQPAPQAAPVRPEPPRAPAAATRQSGHAPAPAQRPAGIPEIISDPSQLPAPVARMRERILEAAKSGSLDRVVTVMQSNETLPVFTFGNDKDPLAHWKANYPDSGGVEALSILSEVMEAPAAHVDKGTPQEMYVWPYFARMPLRDLTPEQKVELFRIVTGSDYKDMQEFGTYIFYRVGIAPDGVWHYFVSGD